MAELEPNSLSLLGMSLGVGFVMLYAGLSKNALEWKRRRTICPSCGRHTRVCGC